MDPVFENSLNTEGGGECDLGSLAEMLKNSGNIWEYCSQVTKMSAKI